MHYSCPQCKRIFFESNPQGTCPECGGELVATGGTPAPPPGGAKAMTLMDQDFLTKATGDDDMSTLPMDRGRPAPALAPTSASPRPPAPSRPPARPSARPQAVGRPSVAGRVAAIVSIVVLGMAVVVLALMLFLGPPEDPEVRATTAGLEQRVAELEKGNAALKAENEKLSAEGKELSGRLEGLPAQVGRAAEAEQYALDALQLLERRSDLDRALRMAEAALSAAGPAAPSRVPVLIVKGRALAAMGKTEAALEAFDAAAGEAGDSVGRAKALALAGETCVTDFSDPHRALGYFKKASEAGEQSVWGLVAQARTSLMDRDWSGAAKKAMAARKVDPSLALAPLILGEAVFGRALEKSGEGRAKLLENADPFLVEALKLDPNCAYACLVRGRLLIEQNSLLAPDRAFGLARFSRQDEAARLLNKAKELSPARPDVYLALVGLRLEKGALRNPAMARALAQEAVELTGREDAAALAALASAHAASGDPAEAAKTAEEALRFDPDNDKLRSQLARYKAEAQAVRKR